VWCRSATAFASLRAFLTTAVRAEQAPLCSPQRWAFRITPKVSLDTLFQCGPAWRQAFQRGRLIRNTDIQESGVNTTSGLSTSTTGLECVKGLGRLPVSRHSARIPMNPHGCFFGQCDPLSPGYTQQLARAFVLSRTRSISVGSIHW
jgi:hypothetical protein